MSGPNVAAGQRAITAAFQTRTLRTPQRSPVVTSLCGLSPASGRIEQAEGRAQARGAYTITLPALSSLELNEGEIVTIDEEPGQLFTIVWAPAKSNLNLSRRYGADEVD